MSGRCEDGELRRVEGRGRDAGRRGQLDLRDCRVEVSPPQVPDVHVGRVVAPVLVVVLKRSITGSGQALSFVANTNRPKGECNSNYFSLLIFRTLCMALRFYKSGLARRAKADFSRTFFSLSANKVPRKNVDI